MTGTVAVTAEMQESRERGEKALAYLGIDTGVSVMEPGSGYTTVDDSGNRTETRATLGMKMLDGALIANERYERCEQRWNALVNTTIRTDLGSYKLPHALIVMQGQDEQTAGLMRMLLGEGRLDPDFRDQCNRTLLILCAAFDDATVAQVVLEAGADIRATFDAGHGVMKNALTIADECDAHEVARVIHAFVAKNAVDAAIARSKKTEPA